MIAIPGWPSGSDGQPGNGRAYAPNRDLILAFLPPKCEEPAAGPEGTLS